MTLHHATFDTLQYVKQAKEIGIPETHAEFQAEQLNKIINVFDEDAITKKDLKHLETCLKFDITHVEINLTKDINHLNLKLNWLMGMIIFFGGGPIIVNGLKALATFCHLS